MSVVPKRATIAAAVGPPRTAAAISGAVETATWTPSVSWTGRADATRVTAVQKTMPATQLVRR